MAIIAFKRCAQVSLPNRPIPEYVHNAMDVQIDGLIARISQKNTQAFATNDAWVLQMRDGGWFAKQLNDRYWHYQAQPAQQTVLVLENIGARPWM